MAKKFPKLLCRRYLYYFTEGWEVVWHPLDPAKPSKTFRVGVRHTHERGGDSVSYIYTGPPSMRSSLHLIKVAIKEKLLPKKA